jgi:hypothetical protein
MANVFWDSAEMLLVVFLKRGTTINSERFVQTLEVKATNSKDSAKQEDASSPLPPNNLDLLSSDFLYFGHLKDALLGRRLTAEEMNQHAGSAPTCQQRVLGERHTASPTEVEKVC